MPGRRDDHTFGLWHCVLTAPDIKALIVNDNRYSLQTVPPQGAVHRTVARVFGHHGITGRKKRFGQYADRLSQARGDDDLIRPTTQAAPLRQMLSDGPAQRMPTKRVRALQQFGIGITPNRIVMAAPLAKWKLCHVWGRNIKRTRRYGLKGLIKFCGTQWIRRRTRGKIGQLCLDKNPGSRSSFQISFADQLVDHGCNRNARNGQLCCQRPAGR